MNSWPVSKTWNQRSSWSRDLCQTQLSLQQRPCQWLPAYLQVVLHPHLQDCRLHRTSQHHRTVPPSMRTTNCSLSTTLWRRSILICSTTLLLRLNNQQRLLIALSVGMSLCHPQTASHPWTACPPSALSPASKNFSWASPAKMISSALPPSTKDAARQGVTRMSWAVHSQRAEVRPCQHLLFLTTTPELGKEHQKMAKKRIVCEFATKSQTWPLPSVAMKIMRCIGTRREALRW